MQTEKVVILNNVISKLYMLKTNDSLNNIKKAVDSCLIVEQLKEQQKNT